MSEENAGRERRLTDQQRHDWLRLIRSENVGPATFRQLVNQFGSARAALTALPELARRGGARRIKIPSEGEIDAEMEAARRMGAHFVAVGEPEYPPLLMRAENPPPLIAAKGRLDLLSQPAIGMVGARNASLSGIKLAQRFARKFGQEGYLVVSGLARGIDAAAHRGSLETGTLAVLAGGLDRPYPPENHELFREICEEGVVVTEMPFGWTARAKDFPRRNRIVAGLSYGVLVVEAAHRSGSLISARLANEMGRLVFAIPGSPLDPRAAGANKLLKEGAILATDPADVLDAVAPLAGQPLPGPERMDEPTDPSAVPPPDESDRGRVLEALGPTPVSPDEIIRHTGLHPAQVQLILLELDLAGRLERHSGGTVSLIMTGD
ncbi:DNA-processing protein DprA [Chelativorans sp. YIM 93263]|uniref:DNA-processing protein DprA n=1 Tax=Chelativorans sp. YIM 93263 TaxID=2906648 RepID=UPI002379E891|nr:DNA-processing protein DprA [Chelativorans sp. YIM 93263]